jgi:hypothetical protein
VFVHFPLLGPTPATATASTTSTTRAPGINVAIAELMVMCSCPLPVCREHVLCTATVAPLLDVAQTLIDDVGSDVQRLQLFDALT